MYQLKHLPNFVDKEFKGPTQFARAAFFCTTAKFKCMKNIRLQMHAKIHHGNVS